MLKGAMLLRLWSEQPYRATRDLDLLRRGDGSFEAIRQDLMTICAVAVDPDAVDFVAADVRIEAIRAEDEYAGARATLPARCGSIRLLLQIDMGLGDSVWPAPQPSTVPALLGFPAPEVLAYPREADDKFMRHLAQVVRNGLGDRAGTCIDPKTQIVQDKTVCVVSCQRSPEPVFLKWKGLEAASDGDFFVRSGPGTVKLPAESTQEYIRTRFAGRTPSAPN